jgi:hypothetical protein
MLARKSINVPEGVGMSIGNQRFKELLNGILRKYSRKQQLHHHPIRGDTI